MAANTKTELFETMAVPRALTRMAIPTIVSQLIALVYNMADTWFIGRTNNPYMVVMQAVNRGRESFWLCAIRQLGLNIPLLILLNRLFGMKGIVWTQAIADILNVIISYIIYGRVLREIIPAEAR